MASKLVEIVRTALIVEEIKKIDEETYQKIQKIIDKYDSRT